MSHANTSLWTFFEQVYRPIKLADSRVDYVSQYRTAIRRLTKAIGHQPTLHDLNAESVRMLIDSLKESGLGRSRVIQLRNRIVTLWRYAHTISLVTECERVPTDLPNRSMEDGTLRHFFETVYRSAELAEACDSTIDSYRSMLRKLREQFGRDINTDEQSHELVEQHQKWLRKHATPESTIRIHCERWFKVWRHAHKLGLVAASPIGGEPEPGTLFHFFETVYRPLRMFGCKPDSVEGYRATMRQMRIHFDRDILIEEQTDVLAAEYFESLLSRGLRGETVNGTRANWFAIWRFAAERGLIDREPKVRKVKAELDEPDAWTEEEAARILHATSSLKDWPPIADIRADLYFRALLLVGWWSGLRRGSLLTIRRADIDLKSAWLNIPAPKMKNKRGRRYRLGPDAIEAVQDILEPERELLFPFPYGLGKLYEYFDELLRVAEISPSTRVGMTKFHKWRRTVATQAVINGSMEVASTLMNHSGQQITLRYIDPSKLPGHDSTAFLPTISRTNGAVS